VGGGGCRLRMNPKVHRIFIPTMNTSYVSVVCSVQSPELSLLNTVIEYLLQVYRVSQKISPRRFSGIFSKRLGIFRPNFTRLSHVSTCDKLQIFIQLTATLIKLRHIKRNHPACVSADGEHFEHMMVVALNVA